jgi:hypothetical protein
MPAITGFRTSRPHRINCLSENGPKAISFWVLNTQSNMTITWCYGTHLTISLRHINVTFPLCFP